MRGGRVAFNATRGFSAINAWHHDVKHDEVRMMLLYQLNGLSAIRSLIDLKAF
jgi:hypothetical protein